MRCVALVLLVVGGGACGAGDGSESSYARAVPVTLHFEADDVSGGVLEGDGDVATLEGDPFGAFIADATAALGAAPTQLAVGGATLSLGTASIETLADMIISDISLALVIDGDPTVHPFAYRATVATGHGSTTASGAGFTTDDLAALDGRFTVRLQADANNRFSDPGAAADVNLAIAFTAL